MWSLKPLLCTFLILTSKLVDLPLDKGDNFHSPESVRGRVSLFVLRPFSTHYLLPLTVPLSHSPATLYNCPLTFKHVALRPTLTRLRLILLGITSNHPSPMSSPCVLLFHLFTFQPFQCYLVHLSMWFTLFPCCALLFF